MDSWQAVQNWAIFGVAVGGLVWYYYPQAKKTEKPQEKAKVREQPAVPKPSKHHQHAKRNEKPEATATATPVTTARADAGKEANDDNALNFAEQMMKARKGTTLKSVDKADARVKTVKQGSALRTSAAPSVAEKELEDVAFTTSTATAGGVEDMLEPTASGPSSLRIAPAQQPIKAKTPKPAKKEEVETKKQRQNRQKNEAKKQQREEEEKERKGLEEKQRRSAREARGEPAKNGIPVSKPPADNAWSSPNGSSKPAAVTATASHTGLLDTFDAESTGSSNAGASTAATSTTEANPSRWTEDLPSEEDQIAAFAAQDDGWNEVKSSKKQKKKASGEPNGASTPVAAPAVIPTKPAAPAAKPLVNGKPLGFQALNDELDQSADFNPNDASSWAA